MGIFISRKIEGCIMYTSHVLIINLCYFTLNWYQFVENIIRCTLYWHMNIRTRAVIKNDLQKMIFITALVLIFILRLRFPKGKSVAAIVLRYARLISTRESAPSRHDEEACSRVRHDRNPKFIHFDSPILLPLFKDYCITGRANVIFCALGLRQVPIPLI